MNSAPKIPSLISELEWGEVEFLQALRGRRRACRTPDEWADTVDALRRWLLDECDAPPSDVFLPLANEPHALGWLDQHLGTDARIASNHAERAGSKHADMSTTTQLYTPRWVADLLAQRCFAISGPAVALDPACGGGQLLLAWVDRLIAADVAPQEAFRMIRGVELNEDAARTCQEVLCRHARRHIPAPSPSLLKAIRSSIVCADALADRVEAASVVLSNPPYMGARSMPPDVRESVRRFRPYDADLFAAFIKRCIDLSTTCCGVLAQQTFWFVRTFEAARRDALATRSLDTFIHLGAGVFRALTGEKASVCAFVLANESRSTTFFDLRAGGAAQKHQAWPCVGTSRQASDFIAIPGAPLAHWLPDALLRRFSDMPRLGDCFEIPTQNKTGMNRSFVRARSEVAEDDIWFARNTRGPFVADDFHAEAPIDPETWQHKELPAARWAAYSKGGPAAPWWGNWDFVVDISRQARTLYRTNPTSNLVASSALLRPGLCYTDFGGKNFSARIFPVGAIADMTGPAIFDAEDRVNRLFALMAVLNSSPVREILNALNPSLHYQVRDVRNLPIPELGPSLDGLSTRGRHAAELASSLLRCGFDLDKFEALSALEHQIEAYVAELYGVKPRSVVRHIGIEKLRT